MIQQINLLRSERSSPRDALQLGPVLLAGLATLLLSALATGHAIREREQSRVQAQTARAALLAASPGKGSQPALDDALAKALKDVRDRLARADAVGHRLREIDATEPVRFSTLMDALSRRTLDGVWLTALSAEAADQRLSLTGRALEANRIPAYLKRLNQEPTLRERQFRAMDIRERDLGAGTRVVEFRLSTTVLAKAGP